MLKVAKRTFKVTTAITPSSLSASMEAFIQSLATSDDRMHTLLPLLKEHEEIFRLVEHYRPHWIKFAVIYVLLGIETLRQPSNTEYTELTTTMIFHLLKKLSKEVSFI